MDLKSFRNERRRQSACSYAKEQRNKRRESRTPDARAIGAALLGLALDEARDAESTIKSRRLLTRLEEQGYDREASLAALDALCHRHAAATAEANAAAAS